MLGGIGLRHRLDDEVGHLGYGIRPSARRRGLASWALGEMLVEARAALGVDRVLVTCLADNAASARTIERCGGVLDGTRETTHGPVLRYWSLPDPLQPQHGHRYAVRGTPYAPAARDGGRVRGRLRRLVGAAVTWEVVVFAVLLVAYNGVRALGGDDPAAAYAHARSVVLAQGTLALDVEHATNRWLTPCQWRPWWRATCTPCCTTR